MGIGALLADGIGDTIRVSLTADPTEEVRQATKSSKPRAQTRGPTSSPLSHLRPLRDQTPPAGKGSGREARGGGYAHSSCSDGLRSQRPREAREADVGIAGGRGKGLVFRKGEVVAR